jgi:hypothetical protein
MIFPSLLALGAHLVVQQVVVHVSADVPQLNVLQVCEGIAIQGGSSFHDQAVAKDRQDCLQSENEVRQELLKRWSTFMASDKTHCINESEMGGDSSYTELLTCLEMARDVRNLGKDQTPPKPAHPLTPPRGPGR